MKPGEKVMKGEGSKRRIRKNALRQVLTRRKEYDRDNAVDAPGPVLQIFSMLFLIVAGLYGFDRLILFAHTPQSGVYGSFHPQGYLIRSLDNGNSSASLQPGSFITEVEGIPVADLFAASLKASPVGIPKWKMDRPLKVKVHGETVPSGSILLRLRPFSFKDLAGPFRIWFLGTFIWLCGSYLLYRYPGRSRVNVLSILLVASALSIFNYSGRHLTLDFNPRLPVMLTIRMTTISVIFSSWLCLILLFLRRRGWFHWISPTISTIYLAPLLVAAVFVLSYGDRLAGYERAMRFLYLWAGTAVTLSFLILLQDFRKAEDAVVKAQLKWVLWGHILGMSPYILFYALPTAFTGTPIISYGAGLAPFPIIVFAYLFSFYRYRLMHEDEVIHSSEF